MLTNQEAQTFADEWIARWNAHDLADILALYTDDVTMSTEYIIPVTGEPSGTLRGKVAVGAYWQKALARAPDLHFDLLAVFKGVGSVILSYRGVRGQLVTEVLFLDAHHRIYQGAAHSAI